MSISKKLRFDIFKRDGFLCGYCGRTPPSVVLEIDHIKPKVSGGLDDINNLLTACFDCNRGKKAVPLSSIPKSIIENLNVLREREAQSAAYNRFIRKIKDKENVWITKLNEIYTRTFPGWELSPSFKNGSLRNTFFKKLPFPEIEEAMEIACDRKRRDQKNCIRYFCGIVWKKINKDEGN